jgi:hypothetical protein
MNKVSFTSNWFIYWVTVATCPLKTCGLYLVKLKE